MAKRLTLIDSFTKGVYEVPVTGTSFVGRSRGNQVVIPQIPASLRVSRVHCSIHPNSDKSSYLIMDEASSHGTFVRGGKITQGMEAILSNGDEIKLGDYELGVEIRNVPENTNGSQWGRVGNILSYFTEIINK